MDINNCKTNEDYKAYYRSNVESMFDGGGMIFKNEHNRELENEICKKIFGKTLSRLNNKEKTELNDILGIKSMF